jgi:hypothetical protein
MGERLEASAGELATMGACGLAIDVTGPLPLEARLSARAQPGDEDDHNPG